MASVTSYTLRILTSVFLTHISLFMSQSIYELTDVQCECQIWHVLKWISSFSLLPCPHQICSSSVFSTWWLIRISQLPKGESWEEPWYPHPFLNIFIQSVIKYCWLHFFYVALLSNTFSISAGQWFPKCASWTTSISITCKLISNANSWVPSQTYWVNLWGSWGPVL